MLKLIELLQHGQSLWLDYIERSLVADGGLRQLVGEGLRGVTSNPTIFHKAITGGEAYDDSIRDLLQADHEIDSATMYEWLAVQDVQMAADVLRPVYDSSHGEDGFVSVEVSPHLAYDTEGTLESARHLWRAVDRPNLLIKVPATREGLPAIERLIAEGISVNVTLLFSVERYQDVMEAYRRGVAMNERPSEVASVASFFVSRVDTKIDGLLDGIGTDEALSLKGKAAIANAKVAYQYFREQMQGEAFRTQRDRGARVQRPLWASTSTKNPAYSDVLYVEELIGADTVNTVPPQTLDAFETHGDVRASLESGLEQARRVLSSLHHVGIDLEKVTGDLETEGVEKFKASHDQILEALDQKRFEVSKRYATY